MLRPPCRAMRHASTVRRLGRGSWPFARTRGRNAWAANDDGIVVRQIIDRRERRALVQFEMRRFGNLRGRGLRHAFDVDGRAGGTRTLGYRVRHGFYVTVG